MPSLVEKTFDERLKKVFFDHSSDLPLRPSRWNGPPPAREWLIEGVLPKGSVALLCGDGGLGKSLLMQQLCTAVALGRNWLGLPTKRMKTYALFCEDDSDELQRRQHDINRHYDCGPPDIDDVCYEARPGRDNILCRFDRWNADPRPTAWFNSLMVGVRNFGAQILVLDTATDVFGGNEIAKDQVRAFITLLRSVAIDIEGGIILTAHVSNEGIATGSGLSGTRAWSNSVRARLWLTGKSKEGGNERYLKTMKANYGPSGGKIPLRWERGVFVVAPVAATRDFTEPELPENWG